MGEGPNVETYFREINIVWCCWMNLAHRTKFRVSCMHSNETMTCIKGGQFLDEITASGISRKTFLPGSFCLFVCFWRDSPPVGQGLLINDVSRSHTHRRITVGRTPLDGWSARSRDLYLTTHNTHNRQTSISPVGFEPTISASERPQTYALDHVATGIGCCVDLI